MQGDGLPKKYIFSHHGDKTYSSNMISWYDQHMNQRDVHEDSTHGQVRHWDGRKQMAWVPEKTDHPLQGAPTNFGLHKRLKDKWAAEKAEAGITRLDSTYGRSFKQHDKEAMVFNHYATRKPLSSHFHSHQINQHLPLRGIQQNMAPEHPPNLRQVESAA